MPSLHTYVFIVFRHGMGKKFSGSDRFAEIFFPFHSAMQNVDCLLGLAGQISPYQPADIARAFRISGRIIQHLLSEKQRCGGQKFNTLDTNQTAQFSLNQKLGVLASTIAFSMKA